MSDQPIIQNEAQQRFEMAAGDDFAYVEYRWYRGNIAFMHTFVPESGRGKGIAAALAKHVLEYAREKSLKIMVYCPYIAGYMKRHPEYNDLLDKKYTG